MDNLGKLAIARQRKRVCAGHTPRISDVKALLDALEAAQKEIARLTAERDAEKKRADALAPAIEDMKQALCCGGFGELSAACSELWRIWDQNDPEFAENIAAPTGDGKREESPGE